MGHVLMNQPERQEIQFFRSRTIQVVYVDKRGNVDAFCKTGSRSRTDMQNIRFSGYSVSIAPGKNSAFLANSLFFFFFFFFSLLFLQDLCALCTVMLCIYPLPLLALSPKASTRNGNSHPPPRMRPNVSIHIPASQQVDRTSPCTLMYVDVC